MSTRAAGGPRGHGAAGLVLATRESAGTPRAPRGVGSHWVGVVVGGAHRVRASGLRTVPTLHPREVLSQVRGWPLVSPTWALGVSGPAVQVAGGHAHAQQMHVIATERQLEDQALPVHTPQRPEPHRQIGANDESTDRTRREAGALVSEVPISVGRRPLNGDEWPRHRHRARMRRARRLRAARERARLRRLEARAGGGGRGSQ